MKGKLIENGGLKPNLHLWVNSEEQIIQCEQSIAMKLNKHLYGDLFVSAWKRKTDDKRAKIEFCDSYLTVELFNEYKTFIESNNHLTESDEYVAIHEKIKGYIEDNQFGKLKKLLRLYNHSSSEYGSLKTILLITKTFKENEHIKELRLELKKILDTKLKKSVQ